MNQSGILDGIGVAGTFSIWLVALVRLLVIRNEYLDLIRSRIGGFSSFTTLGRCSI